MLHLPWFRKSHLRMTKPDGTKHRRNVGHECEIGYRKILNDGQFSNLNHGIIMNALTVLQKTFPQVEKVIDATKSIKINVTPADSASGRKKDAGNCALAKACMREKIADAAII